MLKTLLFHFLTMLVKVFIDILSNIFCFNCQHWSILIIFWKIHRWRLNTVVIATESERGEQWTQITCKNANVRHQRISYKPTQPWDPLHRTAAQMSGFVWKLPYFWLNLNQAIVFRTKYLKVYAVPNTRGLNRRRYFRILRIYIILA